MPHPKRNRLLFAAMAALIAGGLAWQGIQPYHSIEDIALWIGFWVVLWAVLVWLSPLAWDALLGILTSG